MYPSSDAVITSSPLPIFKAFKLRKSASVPLPHETQCFNPIRDANVDSKSSTCLPLINCEFVITSSKRLSNSSLILLWWSVRSLNGTLFTYSRSTNKRNINTGC